jgi:hypothetical protein
MQPIKGNLPRDLAEQLGDLPAAKAPPIHSPTYRSLMEHIARLSYVNKDQLLFFRGQGSDYKNKVGASSFYPSIYRGDRVAREELERRFDLLSSASARLVEAFREDKIEGASDVKRRKLIQWSILQHYEVCATPLLDFTQSVRVACSFAMLEAGKEDPFVYVFGLPYVTNRISVNSEQDIVNVRLLSICPPDALRPYFQEGYLAGTDEVTVDYASSKDELDFNSRLIAKFCIARGAKFWGRGFAPIPKEALYPPSDRILEICQQIGTDVADAVQPSELGRFLQAWTRLESRLLSLAREISDRVYSVVEAVRVFERGEQFSPLLIQRLHEVRQIRNKAVHNPEKLEPGQLSRAEKEVESILKLLKGGVLRTTLHP